MTSRLRLALVLVFASLLAVPATAQALSLQTYPARIHVAGGLTVTSQHGELKNCAPGQEFTLAENADIEVSGRVKVQRIGSRSVSSTNARKPGGAISRNELTSYEESNYCPPDDEPIELDRPNCQTFKGTAVAGLRPDPRRAGPGKVSIGLGRITGGQQEIGCMSLGVSHATPMGSLINRFENVYSAIVLPLGLKVSAFKKLGKGKKLIRTLNVGGDCDGAIVYQGSKISKFFENQTSCEVDGVFNVEIKRLK